jgi:hypothetical protein
MLSTGTAKFSAGAFNRTGTPAASGAMTALLCTVIAADWLTMAVAVAVGKAMGVGVTSPLWHAVVKSNRLVKRIFCHITIPVVSMVIISGTVGVLSAALPA